MNKKKNVIVAIIIVVLIVFVVSSITYAYLLAMTNEEIVDNGSGELDINYVKPNDLTGGLAMSSNREGGLKSVATASLNEGSVDALFNMYITPTVLTNLNIPALKWEVEGVRNGSVVCYNSGDFSSAVVDTKIKILDSCQLDYSETKFTVYIWLDSSLVTTSVGGAQFDAKIGADSVPITGELYRLPNEYQKVEYIESTGTQYIDTGVIPDQDTGFDIVFLTKNAISVSTSEYGSIMGARESSAVNELQITTFKYDSSSFLGTLRYGNTDNNAGITPNKKMHLTLMNKVYTNKDDVKITLNRTFESPASLTVFALNNNGSVTQYGKVQLYSLKLYDGDTMIRYFMPCYRRSDNVLGLYDVVGNNFYTNLGTGTFLKGNNV